MIDYGVFYEFIPLDDILWTTPKEIICIPYCRWRRADR